jgi:hypothetical protein
MNRHIPDDVIIVERNGKVFFLHPTRRYAPLVIAGIGVAMQAASTMEQGKEAEKITKRRAVIDERNAVAVRDATVDEAKIRQERGRRILATQKSQAAAGGIRIDVGSPLVIEAETRANITQDIEFTLERGRAQATALRTGADIERELGKNIKRQAGFSAIGQSARGFGTIANMT